VARLGGKNWANPSPNVTHILAGGWPGCKEGLLMLGQAGRARAGGHAQQAGDGSPADTAEVVAAQLRRQLQGLPVSAAFL